MPVTAPAVQCLGLIAGNGKFPLLLARAAKAKNMKVVAAAIKGDTSFIIRFFVDEVCWFQAGELKRLFEYFKATGVQEVIMAGQVNPDNLFDPNVKLDAEFKELFAAIQDRRADTIFRAVADKLKEHGMNLLDSTLLLKDFLAPKGTLTRRAPTQTELQDIEFGFNLAKYIGGFDIGQTVVIKEKAIVAIEALEGTDKTILRGSKIAVRDAVVVKTSKPQQDDRFDVPVIGPRTIRTMMKYHATCLAIEAGKTLIIDRDTCVQMANKAGICIVAA